MRVAVSHKGNVIIGVTFPKDRKMTKDKLEVNIFFPLKRNMRETETCYIHMLSKYKQTHPVNNGG
jgi:hypothetical protein